MYVIRRDSMKITPRNSARTIRKGLTAPATTTLVSSSTSSLPMVLYMREEDAGTKPCAKTRKKCAQMMTRRRSSRQKNAKPFAAAVLDTHPATAPAPPPLA